MAQGFAKFIHIAIASASELEYHLQFAAEIDQLPLGSFPDVHSPASSVSES